MSVFVHINGILLAEKDARISPFDHGFLYGDGIYETLRTIRGTVFDFSSHVKRLRKSAEIMDLPILWSNTKLEQWTNEVVTKNGFLESRIRISVTRGENGFLFLGSNTPTLCISSTQLTDYTPYQKGITLTAIHMSRLMPKAKTISLLPLILAKQAAQKAGAFECLFLNEKNEVTECSTSNVLYRNGNTLYIPAKTECLPGTMQRIFLEKVSAKGFVVQEKISSLKTVQDAEEVIITNSLFGALPVEEICEKKIQTCPGTLFQKCPIDFAKDILVKHE